jgi:hypothetical protein
MDAVSSHVAEISTSHVAEIGTADWFIVVRINVENHQPVIRFEHGNGGEIARQAIP